MTWTTTIEFDAKDTEDVKHIMSDISSKDVSFLWDIEEGDSFNLLVVKSKDKDTAHKRKCWLTNKVKFLEGCRFKVRWVGE